MKKILSMLICAAMLVGTFAVTSFAVDNTIDKALLFDRSYHRFGQNRFVRLCSKHPGVYPFRCGLYDDFRFPAPQRCFLHAQL